MRRAKFRRDRASFDGGSWRAFSGHVRRLSGLHSRFHAGYAETIQKIQDGAIGPIVTIEENFLRSPYGVTERKPVLSELEWQCSTQYHFRWLSGDDVPQSLVHNMDRASWA